MWTVEAGRRCVSYCRGVRWDRFFEDLEDQLDSEWEAERAALDSEAERLRVSRLLLRERLVALARSGETPAAIELSDTTVVTGRVQAVGADWLALDSDLRRGAAVILPLPAIVSLAVEPGPVVASARDAAGGSALRQRMTLGYVLRDLARKRVPVSLRVTGGKLLTGTIDRAGADHLDLALHDAGAPRRRDAVTGYRIVSFAAILSVLPDGRATVP